MGADVDKVFKALAAPERRFLLDRLRADNGQTLGQLCAHLNMSRQAVTKHLKLLEEANLVATIRRGREKLHYLNPMPIHEIAEAPQPTGRSSSRAMKNQPCGGVMSSAPTGLPLPGSKPASKRSASSR